MKPYWRNVTVRDFREGGGNLNMDEVPSRRHCSTRQPRNTPCVGSRRCSFRSRQKSNPRTRRVDRNPTGSETVSEITKGTDMNSGEAKHSQRNENVSTSPKKQGEAGDALPVGLIRNTCEAQETERREGISRDAQSLKETFTILRDGVWTETKLRLITQRAKENPKFKVQIHIPGLLTERGISLAMLPGFKE